jgi:hypothetical protein
MVFGAPGGNFDLASFSFQVPIFGLLAKPNAATKHRARVSRIGFAFISLRFEKQTLGLVEAERFYANPTGSIKGGLRSGAGLLWTLVTVPELGAADSSG